MFVNVACKYEVSVFNVAYLSYQLPFVSTTSPDLNPESSRYSFKISKLMCDTTVPLRAACGMASR